MAEFTADGVPVPPLTTDETRWQRVVFDETGVIAYQLMDGELVQESADVSSDDGTITLSESGAALHFARQAPDRLRLDGELDGRRVTMALQQVDLDDFTLRSRGFSWVQDYPYFG